MAKKISNITQMDSDIVSMKKMIGDTDISSIGDGTLSGAIDTISKNGGGSGTSSKVFDTFADMETWLKDVSNKGTLEVGSNLYIKESDISDYWVSGVLDSVDGNTGYYYEIEELGAEKLDMSEYDEALKDIKSDINEMRDMASVVTVTDELGEWELVTTLPTGSSDSCGCYGNDKFVIGSGSALYYSTDGKTWTACTLVDAEGNNITIKSRVYDILYANGKFIATLGTHILCSTDGITWIDCYITSYGAYLCYNIDNNTWFATDHWRSYQSSDGMSWVMIDNDIPSYYSMVIPSGITYANGVYIIYGKPYNDTTGNTTVCYSEDGITWNYATIDGDNSTTMASTDILYTNNGFILSGYTYTDTAGVYWATFLYSTDGKSWTNTVTTIDALIQCIEKYDDKFIAGCSVGKILLSDDGVSWTETSTCDKSDYSKPIDLKYFSTLCIVYNSGKFVAIDEGKVAYCEFAKTYTSVSSSIETINDTLSRKVDILTIECDSLASFVNDTLSIGRQCIVRCKDSTGWGPTGVANQWYRCIAIYQNDFDTSISGNIDCSIQMWVGTSVSSSISETIPYVGTIKGGEITGYTLDVKKLATVAELDDLKKSVSDGKTLLAEAITGKGVETASDATFETMASNVSSIVSTSMADLRCTLGEHYKDYDGDGTVRIYLVDTFRDSSSDTINALIVITVESPQIGQISWHSDIEGITLLTSLHTGNCTCMVLRATNINKTTMTGEYLYITGMGETQCSVSMSYIECEDDTVFSNVVKEVVQEQQSGKDTFQPAFYSDMSKCMLIVFADITKNMTYVPTIEFGYTPFVKYYEYAANTYLSIYRTITPSTNAQVLVQNQVSDGIPSGIIILK